MSRVLDLQRSYATPWTEQPTRLWLINICSYSCCFCQQLAPRWEIAARQLADTAVFAYWDTERAPQLHDQIGAVRGTPTIRALIPSLQPGNISHVVEYTGPREVRNLVRFATRLIPSRVMSLDIDSNRQTFFQRLSIPGAKLLLAVLNKSRAAATPPVLRAVSVDFFDDGLQVAELRPYNALYGKFIKEYSIQHLPAVVMIHGGDGSNHAHMRVPPTYSHFKKFLARELPS
mmetsp:Transcript_13747/g.29645  ORF Transcript_13747/g.29645 Transcript_13747/m.29645 type:complete len:231 (+) Transcript_13747:362-1054(+)|eukprot:2315510-Pleurochrysis_carterae.AAC.1